MNPLKNHKLVVVSACCVIVILISAAAYFFAGAFHPQSTSKTRPALPLDVDAVVHNYKISHEKGDNM